MPAEGFRPTQHSASGSPARIQDPEPVSGALFSGYPPGRNSSTSGVSPINGVNVSQTRPLVVNVRITNSVYISIGHSLVEPNEVLGGTLERLAALLVGFESQYASTPADMPDPGHLDGIGTSRPILRVADALGRDHAGAETDDVVGVYLAVRMQFAQELGLHDIAHGLVGVARCPA